jgi:hypothetical protein
MNSHGGREEWEMMKRESCDADDHIPRLGSSGDNVIKLFCP